METVAARKLANAALVQDFSNTGAIAIKDGGQSAPSTIEVGVLDNDNDNDGDPDGDFLTAILAGQPKKGKVELQPDGSFTYRSSKKAKGTDSFTYLAEDASGLNSLATVSIQVKGKKHKKGKK